MVVDVHPDDRIAERDAETFAVTAAPCRVRGLGVPQVRGPRPGNATAMTANVRWLSRYRHSRCLVPSVASVLLEAFADGREPFEGTELSCQARHRFATNCSTSIFRTQSDDIKQISRKIHSFI